MKISCIFCCLIVPSSSLAFCDSCTQFSTMPGFLVEEGLALDLLKKLLLRSLLPFTAFIADTGDSLPPTMSEGESTADLISYPSSSCLTPRMSRPRPLLRLLDSAAFFSRRRMRYSATASSASLVPRSSNVLRKSVAPSCTNACSKGMRFSSTRSCLLFTSVKGGTSNVLRGNSCEDSSLSSSKIMRLMSRFMKSRRLSISWPRASAELDPSVCAILSGSMASMISCTTPMSFSLKITIS
mmetsp:Transcript_7050/g.15418  ORF Transcript_7050/g.15418 Transcript_7050/m.15418 type:complete len:240 (+) Transcript_7050:198-917(+)